MPKQRSRRKTQAPGSPFAGSASVEGESVGPASFPRQCFSHPLRASSAPEPIISSLVIGFSGCGAGGITLSTILANRRGWEFFKLRSHCVRLFGLSVNTCHTADSNAFCFSAVLSVAPAFSRRPTRARSSFARSDDAIVVLVRLPIAVV